MVRPSPRVAICVASAALAAALACRSGRPAHPSVLLVTLDTTRADHVGAYGARGATTPTLDRIASEGVLFERAWSVTPLTTPAHASVMTGLYPEAHGVRNNGRFRIAPGATTLAEVFKRAGYATGAFVGGFPVTREFGFAKGFDAFDDDFGVDARGRSRSERHADEVASRALRWLHERAGASAPFFAWVHFYDAHDPYEPPPPFAQRFAGRLYDGEIAFADDRLGALMEQLRRDGVLERTIVAVAGDHGEGLGDHGEPTHGLFVYEPTIHVPLVIRAPWAISGGERRRDLASLVDLAPTLAGLAGVPAPDPVDGRDLFRAPSPEAPPDDPLSRGPGRAVYAESFYGREEYGWAPLVAVRRGASKWIAAPLPERYDLEADPSEHDNLAGSDAQKDRAMISLLATVTAASSARKIDGAEGRVTDDLLARLQSLGYVGGGGAGRPAAPTGSPGRDPKEALPDYLDYLRGSELIQSGGDAVGVFTRLVGHDPGNPEFRLRLGMAHKARGDLRAAEADYVELIRLYPSFYLAYRRLTTLLNAQGRYAESRDLWLKLRASGGTYVGVEARLAECYLGAGQADQALATCRAGLAATPTDPELLTLAGRALERLGREGEALARYREALAARPAGTPALDAAVALLRKSGRNGEARALVEDCLARSAGSDAVRERLAGL